MTTRRDFLEGSAAALALLAVGCGDDDTGGRDAGTRDAGARDAGTTDAAVPEDAGSGSDAASADAGEGTDGGGGAMCVEVTFVIGDDHLLPHADGISFPAEHVKQVYDIQGASAHPHATVTPSDFAAPARGETVTIPSTNDGARPHTHDVMLACAFG